MKIGIVGLGLIGGSFAKAYSQAGHTVAAFDTDEMMLQFARMSGAVQETLTKEVVPECDLILICTYPEAAIRFMEDNGPYFGSKPVVIDCCGTKQNIVDKGFALAEEYGFTYLGGHPMAGTQFSGFKYAKPDMYVGAPMVLIPAKNDDILFLERVKELLAPAGFGSITVTTAEKHDRVIAFSSQLAHVVSNAYVKSPTASIHTGMSAGSYKDLTRVARLNPEMWTQLFFDNRENLIYEIDTLMQNIKEYRDALEDYDREKLRKLLDDGRRRKEELDGPK